MKTTPRNTCGPHMHPPAGPSIPARGFIFGAKAAAEGPGWGRAKRERGSQEDLAACHALFTPLIFYLRGTERSIL